MPKVKQNRDVYMTFGTKNKNLGTVIFKMFNNITPKTCKNFMELSLKKKGDGYKKCKIHRIIPNFVIQGGDFERGDGAGGYSIYGEYFEDENFNINHEHAGLLSMANKGPDTNGSQFFITLGPAHHLDGKHVVFGKVIRGINVLREVEKYGTSEGTPIETIKILDCGLI